MKNILLRIPSRIPRLYFGPAEYTGEASGREKAADLLHLFFLVLSYMLFIAGGLFGYLNYQIYGLLIFAALGYLGGVWMRRSLGIRGRRPASGFFMRVRERAAGARPGLLELVVEKVSGRELTRAKSRAIIQVHTRALKELKQARSNEEQNRILAGLDRNVKRILDEGGS